MNRFGFVPPIKDENDYHFGGIFSLPKVILQADGNWAPYLPLYERQYGNGWDSFGCTVFGTLNAIETLSKKYFGKDWDYAERYNYNLVGVTSPGADPKKVAQSVREYGVINQEELPMTNSSKEFSTPRPMTQELIGKGLRWLKGQSFGYEWVFQDEKDINKRHQLIKECLRYSPLGVSVSAWQSPENGAFPSNGQPNNHWCMAFKIDDKGQVYIFDSYDQSMKLLTSDHDIGYCMRYNLSVSPEEIQKSYVSILQKFMEILKSYVSILSKGLGLSK